jgi:hypothetical protein
MTGLKFIVRTLVPVTAALLSSCIDCREEYWLRADGSGRAELTYLLPAAVAAAHGGEPGIREALVAFLKQTPEITSSNCEVVTRDKRVWIKIDASFDSALDLKDIVSRDSMKDLPAAANHLAGDIEAEMHGRTLDFQRRISAAAALPGSAFLPDSQLEGHRLTYIMHLPAVAGESNATRTEDGGRTLIWDVALSRAIREPVVTRFKMTVPIPWNLVSAIAVPLSLVSGGWLMLRRRKSRTRFPIGNSGNSVL